MKTFDRWLGQITIGILIIMLVWAFVYQFLNLVLGRTPGGGVAGGRANMLIYDDY